MENIGIEHQMCDSDCWGTCPKNKVGSMPRCTISELAPLAGRVKIDDQGKDKWFHVLAVGPNYFKCFTEFANHFKDIYFRDVTEIETL